MNDAIEQREDDRFGLCPECHRTDGYMNIHSDHRYVCDKHMTKWCTSSNMFSDWKDKAEADWNKNYEMLKCFTEVKPFYWREDSGESN